MSIQVRRNGCSVNNFLSLGLKIQTDHEKLPKIRQHLQPLESYLAWHTINVVIYNMFNTTNHKAVKVFHIQYIHGVQILTTNYFQGYWKIHAMNCLYLCDDASMSITHIYRATASSQHE